MVNPPVTTIIRALVRVLTGWCASVLGIGIVLAQPVTSYLPPDVMPREERDALLHWGVFDINPRVATSFIYDNNITLRADPPQDDLIFLVAPGVEISKTGTEEESATSLRLSYIPALVFFLDHSTNDSVDHVLHFDAGLRLAKLTMTLRQEFESTAGGVVDVGNRLSQEYYRTQGRVRYQFSAKTAFEIGGHYRISDYDKYISSQEWLEDNAVHYQISGKVRLGFGISVGQLHVDDLKRRQFISATNRAVTNVVFEGNSQTFLTPSLRASYRTTEKTDISASVGAEWRFFDDGSSTLGPVFSIVGTYRPWPRTSFSLEAHRRELNSAVLVAQNYIATGVSMSVRQLLHDRILGHVQFRYDQAEYRAARENVRTSREDDYYLLRYGLDVIIAPTWTAGIYHQYRENKSSEDFSFRNHQVGLQSVWSY